MVIATLATLVFAAGLFALGGVTGATSGRIRRVFLLFALLLGVVVAAAQRRQPLD